MLKRYFCHHKYRMKLKNINFQILIIISILVTVSVELTPLFAQSLNGTIKDNNSTEYDKYNGKIIRNISYHVKPIFTEENLEWVYRTANNLKIETKEKVMKREILFKEGDKFNRFVMQESERQLRQQKFFQAAKIFVTPVGDNEVDVQIVVQDNWTLIPQGGFSNGGGSKKREIGLSESNMFGLGKRFDFLLSEVDNRKDTEFIWDDQRFFDTRNRFFAAFFDREDGSRFFSNVGLPYRSVLDPHSWNVAVEDSDYLGRLFQNNDERYLFRKDVIAFNGRYSFADKQTEKLTTRYSIGINYSDTTFSQAEARDYEILDLDPDKVSNDIELLPFNRRYAGPMLGYQELETDLISLAYVDRFERVEDYNLGDQFSTEFFIAPKSLGSRNDAFELSSSKSLGHRFGKYSFLRYDLGVSSRYEESSLDNSLIRNELKYYNVLGDLYVGNRFAGKHTLAAQFVVDYGRDLDRDRELLVGSSNSIRGYTARAFSGDKRLTLNLEDRFHLVDNIFKLVSAGGVVFFDMAGATRDSFGNLIENDIYSDVGFGIRLGFPKSSGGGIVRLDVAFPLRDGPDGTKLHEPRIIASVGQVFGGPTRSETLGPAKANLAIGVDND